MVNSGNVGLILDINLVQHYILLAVLLTFLARAINTYISVHTVASLKIVDLLTQAVLLLDHVILLVRRPAHIVANKIASVVDQLLLPLQLLVPHVLRLCILVHVHLVRLVGCYAFLLVLHVQGRLLAGALVVNQNLLVVLETHRVGLLHHRLPLVQAARLVILRRLLTLVLQNNACIHVALINGNALRLILLAQVISEIIGVSFSPWRVLTILAHFCAFHFLIVYLNFLLVSYFVVV